MSASRGHSRYHVPDLAAPARGEDEAQRAEQVVKDSGIDWTILRCSWFTQNFSENFLVESVRSGEVVLPAGDVKEHFIDAEDIADVAVAALTGDGHAGQLYEMTGPRLMTFAEAIGEIARTTGREVRYTQVSAQEYADAIAEQKAPADLAWLLNHLFTTVLDSRNAYLSDGVQRVLGRYQRDFYSSLPFCAEICRGVIYTKGPFGPFSTGLTSV